MTPLICGSCGTCRIGSGGRTGVNECQRHLLFHPRMTVVDDAYDDDDDHHHHDTVDDANSRG